mmetsp:Transcript_16091/g.61374  ORF Transcript_16091/g.61374 Transcript_16091/m.61374 type:complete len:597 (+) Transcript_16091:1656-3446(+)
MRKLEDAYASLVDPESFFEELVLLQVLGIVEDHLGRRRTELKDPVVRGTHGLGRPKTLLHVQVETPHARVSVEAILRSRCAQVRPRIFAHRAPARRGCTLPPALQRPYRLGNSFVDDLERLLEVLVKQLDFAEVAVHTCELVHCSEGDIHCLPEDKPRAVQILLLHVQLCESDPELRQRLPHGLLRVNRLDRIPIRERRLRRLVPVQLASLYPLGYVMRILPQQHGVDEEGPLRGEVLQPGQAEVHVVSINIAVILLILFVLLLQHGQLGSHHLLLEGHVRVEDKAEIADRQNRVERLFVDISGPLELSKTHMKICQAAPELPYFVAKPLGAAANDGLHRKRVFAFLWMLGAEVAQLHPQGVLGCPRGRFKLVVVDAQRQLLGDLRPLLHGHQILDVLLSVVGAKHEVPAVHAHRGFLHAEALRPAQVRLPDPLVLGHRQSLERTIEDLPGSGALAQVHQQLRVVQPDSGHAVQVHEGSFVGVHEDFQRLAAHTPPLGIRPTLLEVHPPQLVAHGQQLERSLVDAVSHARRRNLALIPVFVLDVRGRVVQVSQPALEAVRVPSELLLVLQKAWVAHIVHFSRLPGVSNRLLRPVRC